MLGDAGDDPVIASVAAYSTDPRGYQQHDATHLLDRPRRFASLLPAYVELLARRPPVTRGPADDEPISPS